MSNPGLIFLEWDSHFFGRKIYRLNVDSGFDVNRIPGLMNETKADFLYIFSSEELLLSDTSTLLLADRKVTFTKTVNVVHDVKTNVVPVNRLSETLIRLAILSGNYSRFRLDTRLSAKFEEMYLIWIRKSLSREIASEVFAYSEDKAELGFVTIKQKGSESIIGLIAVDENHQGKKIGSALLKACENWCSHNNITSIDVATQLDNIQACEFYKRNGYTIKQIDYIYHYSKH